MKYNTWDEAYDVLKKTGQASDKEIEEVLLEAGYTKDMKGPQTNTSGGGTAPTFNPTSYDEGFAEVTGDIIPESASDDDEPIESNTSASKIAGLTLAGKKGVETAIDSGVKKIIGSKKALDAIGLTKSMVNKAAKGGAKEVEKLVLGAVKKNAKSLAKEGGGWVLKQVGKLGRFVGPAIYGGATALDTYNDAKSGALKQTGDYLPDAARAFGAYANNALFGLPKAAADAMGVDLGVYNKTKGEQKAQKELTKKNQAIKQKAEDLAEYNKEEKRIAKQYGGNAANDANRIMNDLALKYGMNTDTIRKEAVKEGFKFGTVIKDGKRVNTWYNPKTNTSLIKYMSDLSSNNNK